MEQQLIHTNNLSGTKSGVGALIIATKDSRVLLSMRASYKTHAHQWSLFGGMVEPGESPKDALLRELSEEMGFVPDFTRIYPFDVYHSKDGQFNYISFVIIVEEEFTPNLNKENCGYCWINLGEWPRPIHQGIRSCFTSKKSLDKINLILSQHAYKE